MKNACQFESVVLFREALQLSQFFLYFEVLPTFPLYARGKAQVILGQFNLGQVITPKGQAIGPAVAVASRSQNKGKRYCKNTTKCPLKALSRKGLYPKFLILLFIQVVAAICFYVQRTFQPLHAGHQAIPPKQTQE